MATIQRDSPTPAPPARPKHRLLKRVAFVAFVLAFVAFAIWLATIEFDGALGGFVTRYGYIGYFIAASIAGINVFVPTTHLIFTAPLLNAGLNPWLLVLCGATGATLADGVGYFIGSSGRSAFSDSLGRVAQWLARAVARRPQLAPLILFLWAGFMPLPNEILVIPAGVLGYGVVRTGLITLSGNILFNILAVVLGLAVL
ncbi:MAG: DedA family protein [Longimicrobiales bacterium]